MDEQQAVALNTSIVASRTLSLGAQRLSASLDGFSSWLLAGFGAVFGLLIANLSDLSEHIAVESLKSGTTLFLIAAAFAAVQKLLAAYVSAGTASGEDGRAFGKELASSPTALDVQSMYSQVQEGLFWPLSALNARITEKANSGDIAVIGRHHAKASQMQLACVALQCLLSLAAGAHVVSGIAI